MKVDWTAIAGWATVIGIALTLYQIHRTRTAAEAARDAAFGGEHRQLAHELLLLLPELQLIEGALEDAVYRGSRDVVVVLLSQWRRVAIRAHASVSAASGSQDLQATLTASNAQVTTARGLVVVGADLAKSTDKARGSISRACEDIARQIALVRQPTLE